MNTLEKVARLLVSGILLVPALTLLILVWLFALLRMDAMAKMLANALYDLCDVGMKVGKMRE